MLVGVRVTPVGAFTRLKVTVPVNPRCGVRVRVVFPDWPCWILRLLGLRLVVKLGEAVVVCE
jgi:hypothetical protein